MSDQKQQQFRDLVNHALGEVYPTGPESLTEPVMYVLDGAGKRLRPFLTLISAEACCGNHMVALSAAVSIEVLHNFTLVHDDIMDEDVIRHGQPTVHEKWDVGSAILTGDAMVSLALKLLLKSDKNARKLLDSFTEGLLRVCEGQALDKEFETRDDVSLDEYTEMIDLKTGHLVGLSAELGAIAAGADDSVQYALRDYGRLIGRAFQVQDDMLEVYSDAGNMGKSLKSDIILGKKTFLMIQAFEQCPDETHAAVELTIKDFDAGLASLRKLLEASGIAERSRQLVQSTISKANQILEALPIDTEALMYFSNLITNRKK